MPGRCRPNVFALVRTHRHDRGHGGAALPVSCRCGCGACRRRTSRSGQTNHDASRLVQRGGWQVFGYAFLFRLQSFVLGGFAVPANLLKVDILNVMGPAIAVAGMVWGSCPNSGWARPSGFRRRQSPLPSSRPPPWVLPGSTLCRIPSSGTSSRRKGGAPSRSFRGPHSSSPERLWASRSTEARDACAHVVSGGRRHGWRPPLRGRSLGGTPADALPRSLLLDDVAGLCCGTSGAYAGDGGPGLVLDVEAMARRWQVRRRSNGSGPGRCSSTGSMLSWSTASRPGRFDVNSRWSRELLPGCHVAAMYALLLGWNRLSPCGAISEYAFKIFKINDLDAKTARVTDRNRSSRLLHLSSMAVEIPRAGRYNAAPLELDGVRDSRTRRSFRAITSP